MEIVSVRLDMIGVRAPLHFESHPFEDEDAGHARKGRRPVYFEPHGFVDTDIYDGERVRPGNLITGPAIIEEANTSVVIYPNQEAMLDQFLTYVIQVAQISPMDQRPKLSPVKREILRHNLRAIVDDMSIALEHNSPVRDGQRSPRLRRGLHQREGVRWWLPKNPFHTPSLALTAQAILDYYEFNLRAGDLVVTNDPYRAGRRPQDLTVFAAGLRHRGTGGLSPRPGPYAGLRRSDCGRL